MSRFLEVATPLFRFYPVLLSFGVLLFPFLDRAPFHSSPIVSPAVHPSKTLSDLQWIGPFSNGLSIGYHHGRFFAWDSTGQILLDSLPFQNFGPLSVNLWPVQAGHSWGYYDLKSGRYHLSPQYLEAGVFQQGLAKVCSGGVYGVIDTLGHWRIPPRYEKMRDPSQGFIAVLAGNEEEGAWGFMDTSGQWNVDPTFAAVLDDFREGKAVVSLPGLTETPVAFIDSSGGLAIPQTFRNARGFQENYAAVQCAVVNSNDTEDGGLWGFIDTSGQWLLPCKYLEVQNFRKGKALVRPDRLYWELANNHGQIENRFPDHCRPEMLEDWIRLQCPEGEKLIPPPSSELSDFFRTILPISHDWIAVRHDSKLNFTLWKRPWRNETIPSNR